jgi:Acetyltransferases
MKNVNIITRTVTAEEFIDMRKSVGWNYPDSEIVERGLNNTLFSVCAEVENTIVAYGRIIGDGAFTLYIQDIMVKPNYQRTGIGMAIMTEIMAHINNSYGKGTMVCLMAAKGKEDFYKKFNFIERPNEHFGAGMIQFID